MPRSQVALTIWGRTYRRALRRGCDHGYAAYLADRAEKRATVSAEACQHEWEAFAYARKKVVRTICIKCGEVRATETVPAVAIAYVCADCGAKYDSHGGAWHETGCPALAETAPAVQDSTAFTNHEQAGKLNSETVELDLDTSGLIPLAVAAQKLCIEPKRLLGYLIRNKATDPIGGEIDGQVYVYDWSLESLRKRLASTSSVSRP